MGLNSSSIEEIPATCGIPDDLDACVHGGGKCEILRDGYYATNLICIMWSGLIFWAYLRRKVLLLQVMPKEAWSLKKQDF